MPQIFDIAAAIEQLTFVTGRTPESTDEELDPAFATLSDYRDGGIFVGHYAGDSAWERHGNGDEIVYALEGTTTLFMLDADGNEQRFQLTGGQMTVVPAGTWHRFETPDGVKIMTVTPAPTDHSATKPEVP